MTKAADLSAYLAAGRPPLGAAAPLAGALLGWMEASPRFTAFVETYRDKIRKKIRVAGGVEGPLDLRAELQAAYRLLDDRRLAVAYEPYASAKRRGPDFAVTYRENLVFNLEVARLRMEPGGVNDTPRPEERLLRILLNKLGQMQPGMANLLVIQTPPALARSIELDRLMQSVKARAEAKDPAFYTASRYANPAAFYKDFLRLSALLLWAAGAQAWVNKPARPALPESALRAVVASLDSAPGDEKPVSG